MGDADKGIVRAVDSMANLTKKFQSSAVSANAPALSVIR